MVPIDLAVSFVGRPDLAALWQKVSAGATDFSPAEKVQLVLAESRAHEKAGNIARALELAQSALDDAQRENDTAGIAGGLAHLALAHFRLGHYDEANRLASESLTLAQNIADSVTAWFLIGLCAMDLSNYAQAEEAYHCAADLARQVGYPLGLSLALYNLATVHFYRGKFQLALDVSAESSRINAEIGFPNWGYLLLQSQIYQTSCDRQGARAALAHLAAFVRPGSPLDALHSIIDARLAMDEDDLDLADQLITTVRGIGEKIGNPIVNVWVRENTSRCYRLRGDAPAASAWADEAVALARRMGNRSLEGWALIERAQVAWGCDDLHAAEKDLDAARDVLTPLGSMYELARVAFFRAALYHQQNHPARDAAWLDAAKRIQQGGYEFILERERARAFPLLVAQLRGGNRASAEALLERLARVAPLPLRIVGLGDFQVWQGRRQIESSAWQKRKAGELFRFLLLQKNHAAARDEILDALWREHAPESALSLSHQAISTLRRILEPDLPHRFPSRYIGVDGERITLDLPSGSTVDFERAARELKPALAGDDADALTRALELAPGDLFPLDRYADWSAGERERLAQMRTRGLLRLAQLHFDAGRFSQSLDACRDVLVRDAWQEDAALIGMQSCLALNDRPGALRLYRGLERKLRDDLQLSPREDLTRLAESLRR